jgi:putative nucleotidyltransferase with HDIG domain
LNLATAIDLAEDQQEALYYAALLHDVGATTASADLCREQQITEESLFGAQVGMTPEQVALRVAPADVDGVVKALHSHPREGAKVARALGFDSEVQEAIATHHEWWDGDGYKAGLKGDQIPIIGRLVGAADLIELLIATDPNPLASRRNLESGLAEHSGSIIEPDLARLAHLMVRSDTFWLGLHNSTSPEELISVFAQDSPTAERSLADVLTFAKVFARLGDAKGEHTEGHSERTAEIADHIGQALDFDEGRRELLRVAALSHHIGLLGGPARVIAKPDILSLAEMETMRRHPAYSQKVLEALPGMEEVATWVGAHHERPDGKGYPEMLDDETIPLEARIISLADTYVALTSARPYRDALSEEDAKQVLEGGAGTQLDKKLVELFCSPTFSRSAPRSPQTQ